jgi:crotonobetainyl-CoA:carnitine CoA-transferase CaiB-like acyl-CoA transferase
MTKTGPLAGLKILEIAGIGPAPFCGMLLADLGADVVVIERVSPNSENIDLGSGAIVNRGKRVIALDLKSPEGVAHVLDLVQRGDVLIEGMRPGVMERLGLGPEVCLARNHRLVSRCQEPFGMLGIPVNRQWRRQAW